MFNNGTKTFERQLTKQNNGKGDDGLVQSAFIELGFDDIFSANADGGGYKGYLQAQVIAPDEPYMAFDFAEISTRKLSAKPPKPKSVPEPGTLLALIAFGGYGGNSVMKRKLKSLRE